jgi:DNA-binding MarR family transcriptional regulator
MLSDMADEDSMADTKTLPIYDNPGHLARRLHQIAVSIFLVEAEEFGITPVQYSALTATRHFPGIDQRALARIIAFDRSTIGDVVTRLEKKGLIRRDAGRDKRTKSLFISETGSAILDQMEEPIRDFQRTLLQPLSEGEQHIFMYLLRKLVNHNNELSRVPLELAAGDGD